jgi:hydrogenase nickel incorporation protein HypA/HybF
VRIERRAASPALPEYLDMHELTICENLLDMIDREHQSRHFTRVCQVRLEIGRFSCLDPDALRYAFEIFTRGTILDGAALRIDQPPGQADCLDCGAVVELQTRLSNCLTCGSTRLRANGGDQMRFIDMEVM